MSNTRKLREKGQIVKGAISAFLTPKLAADKAIEKGELDKLILAIAPAPFAKQVPHIVKGVGEVFGKRLAKDETLEGLEEILESLPAEGTEDKCGSTDGEGEPAMAAEDGPEEAGKKLMEIISKFIPAGDIEAVNALINKMMGGVKAPDEPAEPTEPAKPAGDKEPEVTKEAMDAAIAKAVKDADARHRAIAKAVEDVTPYIGRVDSSAADSAAVIYKTALDSLKVDLTDVPPEAYRAVLLAQTKPDDRRSMPIMDSKTTDEYTKMYPHIPAKI